jgi:enamine deaminase RidA (YjgF/YER057c/UK114 family)
MENQKIVVKYNPRPWQSFKRPVWSDSKPFVVYVDGQVALDKQGRERRFETEAGAKKAFGVA